MKKIIIPVIGGIIVLNSSGYLNDAKYLLGGITRAGRCLITGICILNRYFYVLLFINRVWDMY